MKTTLKKVVVIDAYSMLYKGYYGSLKRKNLSYNREGKLINALFVFVAKIKELIDSEKYYTILVCFDVGKKCWRQDLYPEYKATRKEVPEDLIPQMTLVRDFLTHANIPWYEKETFEGDDVIGTVTNICYKLGYFVDILSNDKDIYQLVNENVNIISQQSKHDGKEIIDIDRVHNEFSVEPQQIPDLKSLIGDKSDNIKGVFGINYLQVTNLLKEFKSVEGIYENIDKVSDPLKTKLINNKEKVMMNKKITTILKNVPIGRIDLKPMKVNYFKFLHFLKREKMWVFVESVRVKAEFYKNRSLNFKKGEEFKEMKKN